jgi:beta-galactosidase
VANREVALEIEGKGRPIGLDNGHMRGRQDYKGRTRRAYNGMCLVNVQSTAREGKIRVTAASPGLQPASLFITAAA